MPTLKEQVEAVVADLVLNEARLDVWVNGTDSQDYTTSGGATVPSIRKFIAETFKFQGTYAAGGTNYTIGQTFKGATGDDRYKMFRVTANFTSTTFAGDSASYETLFDFAQVVADAETAQAAAETAQAAAEAAQSATEAVFDSFDDRYLGTFASDPTQDNDGNALQDGAIYWNTTSNTLRFYDLGNTVWVDPTTDAAASASAAAASAANAATAVAGKAFAGGVQFAKTSPTSTTDSGNAVVPAHLDFSKPFSISVICSFDYTYTQSENDSIAAVFQGGGTGAGVILDRWRVDDNTFDDSEIIIDLGTRYGTGYIADSARTYHFVVTFDGSDLKFYADGVLEFTQASADVSNAPDGNIILGEDVAGFSQLAGSLCDFATFNRALSSAEAAALYNQGLQGWLAANPGNKWGSPTAETEDFEDGTTTLSPGLSLSGLTVNDFGGTEANYDGVADPDGIGGASSGDHCYKFTVGAGINGIRIGYSGGEGLFLISFDYYNPSANTPDLSWASPDVTVLSGNLSTKDAWTSVACLAYVSSTNGPILRVQEDGATSYYDNFEVTKLGCLAALPMDEGIGYQLHDLSDNKFDALLSTSGFEHLKPKREGFIRDFNVDAYNGGSGEVELVSSSRDILPANCVLVDGSVRNNGGAAITAGALDVKRSDRTTRNTVGDNNGILNAGNVEGITFTTDQIPDDNNIALDASTDSDATDVDVRVDYEMID